MRDVNLEIRFDNLLTHEDIIVKRFFLVNFLKPREKRTNLRSYLCLIWRYNTLHINNNITISLKFHPNIISGVNDVHHFFGETTVLKQFWASYAPLPNINPFIESFTSRDCKNPNLAASLVRQCNDIPTIDNQYLFCSLKDEKYYDHIFFPLQNIENYFDFQKRKMIITPQNIGIGDIFKHRSIGDINPTFLPCFAIWIGWEEDLQTESFKSFNQDITYEVRFSNNLSRNVDKRFVQVSELGVYFFLPHSYELDSQSCNYPTGEKYSNEVFELERSYSQQRLEYFDEWEKLGVKSQSAFRTHMSRKFSDYFRNNLSTLQFLFTVADRDSRINASMNLTIATLIISLLWEIGHENLSRITVMKSLKYISPDAFWFLMNMMMFLGAVRVFFFNRWFSNDTTVKEKCISFGIVIYTFYYIIFMIFNIGLHESMQNPTIARLKSILFYPYFFHHFIIVSVALYLVNKFVFRILYKKFKLRIFR
ncbi:hypothetical protein JW960_20140 [candidate division KSB1 bacterium]|nr:hypothetical protein [candidate division KSB1 bacterium]